MSGTLNWLPLLHIDCHTARGYKWLIEIHSCNELSMNPSGSHDYPHFTVRKTEASVTRVTCAQQSRNRLEVQVCLSPNTEFLASVCLVCLVSCVWCVSVTCTIRQTAAFDLGATIFSLSYA